MLNVITEKYDKVIEELKKVLDEKKSKDFETPPFVPLTQSWASWMYSWVYKN